MLAALCLASAVEGHNGGKPGMGFGKSWSIRITWDPLGRLDQTYCIVINSDEMKINCFWAAAGHKAFTDLANFAACQLKPKHKNVDTQASKATTSTVPRKNQIEATCSSSRSWVMFVSDIPKRICCAITLHSGVYEQCLRGLVALQKGWSSKKRGTCMHPVVAACDCSWKMLEHLQAKAQEKLLLEATEDVDLRSEPVVDAPKLGCLECGQVVLACDFQDGWARLHEDEIWASEVSEESAYILVDGRKVGLNQRFFRVFSKNLEDWPYFEALRCAEANGVSWRKLPRGLRPKGLMDLAWLSSWHSPDGTLMAAPALLHDDHRCDHLPKLCVASMVRGIPGKLLESLILQHHANGFQHVMLYFDSPDDEGEADAISAVQKFSRPLPTGPNGILCSATAILCTDQWWSEVRQKSRYYLREDEQLELYRETTHLDTHIKDVQARQMLCIEHALFEAQSEGFQWLLHVDADEILFFPDQSRHCDARKFFAEVPLHFSAVRFANLEAVPEHLEVDDPFEEVSLFKMSPMLLEELGVEPRILYSGEVAEEDEEFEPDLFARRHADAVPGGRSHGYVRLPRRERHALRRLLSIMHEIASKRTEVLESLNVTLSSIEQPAKSADDSSDDESCHGPRPHCPAYFNSYSNGKCAVRTSIGPRGELPPLPAGVHGFLRDGGMTLYTLLCKGPGAPVVLHYANCGFSFWRRKYDVLCKDHGTEDGAFSTLRPGISEIRSHIATRQLVLKGNDKELEQFYQTFVPWIAIWHESFLGIFCKIERCSRYYDIYTYYIYMIYVRYVEKYSQRHGISRFLGEFCNRWREMTMTNSPSWPNLVWCFACLCHVKGQGIVQTAQIYPPQNSHSHWKQAIPKGK